MDGEGDDFVRIATIINGADITLDDLVEDKSLII